MFEIKRSSDRQDYLIKNASNKGIINMEDGNGNTPLMYAAENGNKDIVKLLIDKGANVNKQDKNGKTPLMYAVVKGNKDIVKLLIENGAIVNKQNKDGQKALDYVENININFDDNGSLLYNKNKTKETREKITELLNNPLQFDIGLSSNDFNI